MACVCFLVYIRIKIYSQNHDDDKSTEKISRKFSVLVAENMTHSHNIDWSLEK